MSKVFLLQLGLAFLSHLFNGALGDSYELSSYESCRDGKEMEMGDTAQALSFDADHDFLWVASSNDVLSKLRFSDGTLLAKMPLNNAADPGSKPDSPSTSMPACYDVAHMSCSKAAVSNSDSSAIIIAGTDIDAIHEDIGSVDSLKVLDVIYVTGGHVKTMAYDIAYGRFIILLDNIHDHDGVVVQLDMATREETVLFHLKPDATSFHYASNTGSLFFLCPDCKGRQVQEVTLKGEIQDQNYKSLDSMGTASSLTMSRGGHRMLALFGEGEDKNVAELCGTVYGPLPALLPEKVIVQDGPSKIYPLNTYQPCGTKQLGGVNGGKLMSMAIKQATWSIWAVVDGGLHEYDLEGRLLRAMPKDYLETLGLQMITSVAEYKGRKLLLGSQKGNRVFAIDTATMEMRASAFEMACSKKSLKTQSGTAGDSVMGFGGSIQPFGPLMGCAEGEDAEPQGENFENEVARAYNAISVEWNITLPEQNFLGEESYFSLGSIEYDSEADRLLYVSVGPITSTSRVFSYSLNGGAQAPQDEDRFSVLLDADKEMVSYEMDVSSAVYSPATDKLILLSSSPSSHQLVEVSYSAGSNSEPTYTMTISKNNTLSSLAASKDGTILFLGTESGEVSVYCNDGRNGGLLAQVSKSALQKVNALASGGPADLLYFWRAATELETVQGEILVLEENLIEKIPPPGRPSDGSNIACFVDVFDGDHKEKKTSKFFRASGYSATAWPGTFPNKMLLWECERACKVTETCRAYTYDLQTSMCILYTFYNGWTSKLQGVIGIKFGGDSKWPSLPEPSTLPPVSPSKRQKLPGSRKGDSLVGGWEWDGEQDCAPWDDTRCGLSGNPGLRVQDITWYRMFAHKANPLVNRGGGVVEWKPFRERRSHGTMYYKGSEILGYFDKPKRIYKEGDEVDVAFRWSSDGETQDEICPARDATKIDCEKCERDYANSTGEKHIYHEVRCFSGTGDFRIALVDFSRSHRGLGEIDKDGYGYYNKAMLEARGLQWRFHPHACPRVPRERPGGYAATAASSWIRSNIKPFEINSRGLVCDFIEDGLRGRRSFKERLYDPADNGACLALPTGKWTPWKAPLRLELKILKVIEDREDLPRGYVSSEASDDEIEEQGPWITFRWTMGFNGWRGSQVDTWHSSVFPHQIDAFAVGYTNPRSFTSLKLKYLKHYPSDRDIPKYRSNDTLTNETVAEEWEEWEDPYFE